MVYQFHFNPYRYRFLQPLVTSHGIWDTREGIIVRLDDAGGNSGWGEIAPISWFGSETLEQALDFCRQVPREITPEIIFSLPDNLPACQFGFESALASVHKQANSQLINEELLTYSALLPSGKTALQQWQQLWNEGYRTFKWKIGIDAINTEVTIFEILNEIAIF